MDRDLSPLSSDQVSKQMSVVERMSGATSAYQAHEGVFQVNEQTDN